MVRLDAIPATVILENGTKGNNSEIKFAAERSRRRTRQVPEAQIRGCQDFGTQKSQIRKSGDAVLRGIAGMRPRQYPGFRFHAAVASLTALWLSLTVAGCLLTHVTVPGITEVITRYVAMGPVAIWILAQF